MRKLLQTSLLFLAVLLGGQFLPLNPEIILVHSQIDHDFAFIAYGDTRGSGDNAVAPIHQDFVNMFLQHNPEFVIHTGDMVNRGGIWNQWLSFNVSIRPLSDAGIPLFGVVGNHEKYTDQWNVFDEDFSNYTTFFDFSDVIDEPGETELHYSFDFKGIHFIILDTEDYFDYNTEIYNCSNSQMEWLLTDLSQTTPEDFIVASYHRPAWSIRQNSPYRWAQAETIRHEFHNLFVQYDVDLVFCGHDHYYYRGIRDDIYYVVTGGGGAPLYPPDPSAPHWQEGDVTHQNYHYCHIAVTSTEVSVRVLKLDNSTIDSFTIPRRTLLISLSPPIQLLLLFGIIGIIIIFVETINLWERHKR